jgi:hypothetical protein
MGTADHENGYNKMTENLTGQPWKHSRPRNCAQTQGWCAEENKNGLEMTKKCYSKEVYHTKLTQNRI